MKYYGIICCELDGSLDPIEGEHDYKPPHEACGFTFCKWFESKEKRDACQAHLAKTIHDIQTQRGPEP